MTPESPTDADRPPTVTVIIPVYNDVDRLRTCLDLVQRQDYPAGRYDVVVVDNASAQDLRPALPQDDDRFRLVLESRRGSYVARNTGVRHARGEVLAFTDGDCLPRSDWIRQGVAALHREPRPDAVGGDIVLTFRQGQGPQTGPEWYDAREGLPQEHFVLNHQFAVTANLFVRAETFHAVGPFDASLRSGGDREWGERLAATGRRFAFAAAAVVDHPSRPTWGELTRKHRRIANGMADLEAAAPARTVLADLSTEARGALSFCKEVWTLDTPRGFGDRLGFAAAFCYVRLLRSGIRLRRLAVDRLPGGRVSR